MCIYMCKCLFVYVCYHIQNPVTRVTSSTHICESYRSSACHERYVCMYMSVYTCLGIFISVHVDTYITTYTYVYVLYHKHIHSYSTARNYAADADTSTTALIFGSDHDDDDDASIRCNTTSTARRGDSLCNDAANIHENPANLVCSNQTKEQEEEKEQEQEHQEEEEGEVEWEGGGEGAGRWGGEGISHGLELGTNDENDSEEEGSGCVEKVQAEELSVSARAARRCAADEKIRRESEWLSDRHEARHGDMEGWNLAGEAEEMTRESQKDGTVRKYTHPLDDSRHGSLQHTATYCDVRQHSLQNTPQHTAIEKHVTTRQRESIPSAEPVMSRYDSNRGDRDARDRREAERSCGPESSEGLHDENVSQEGWTEDEEEGREDEDEDEDEEREEVRRQGQEMVYEQEELALAQQSVLNLENQLLLSSQQLHEAAAEIDRLVCISIITHVCTRSRTHSCVDRFYDAHTRTSMQVYTICK